jgi:hypothetical protein
MVALTAIAKTYGWQTRHWRVRDPETYPAFKKPSEMHRYLRPSDGPEMPCGGEYLRRYLLFPALSALPLPSDLKGGDVARRGWGLNRFFTCMSVLSAFGLCLIPSTCSYQ